MALFYIGIALIVALLIRSVHRHYTDPLRKFPGPFLASWTYLWRFQQAIVGATRIPNAVKLHRKYGDVVRMGPNVLSFSDPQAIKDIYGTDKQYHRSSWYETFATTMQGNVVKSLFATSDTEWHDNLKRAVNPAFSLSALVSYEPYVTSTVSEFLNQLEARYANKSSPAGANDLPDQEGVIDLCHWMQWYAFDVIGELTYGKPFGFLKTASDVDNIIRDSHAFMSSKTVVSAFPGLDKLLRKNPVLLWLNRRGYFNSKPNPVVAFALKNRQNRDSSGHRLDADSDGRADLLHKFIQSKQKYPQTITEREVLGMSLSMIFAGSESTGTTLTAIFYHLLKHPSVLAKLVAEIDSAFPPSSSSSPPTVISFKEAFNPSKFPYLDACIKETFRIHPAARFAPERVLPSSPPTTIIAGKEVPGGTVVGVNAWAIHRREEIFGPGTEGFRPERWIVAPGEGEEKVRMVEGMNRGLFHFGAGKFGCIGRNVSLMEMYKVVPSLLRRFEFGLVDEGREWRLEQGGFVNIRDVFVRVKLREGK